MIFDRIMGSFNNNAEKELEKEARVRGLDYEEVKADADSGLVIDGCSFGSKYALVRNGKKSVLMPYNELFWVFGKDCGNDRINIYFVTVYHVINQINNMKRTDGLEICNKILAADRAVLFGFREEYAKLYDDHPDDLKEVKRQLLMRRLYEELKKDAEERKARGEAPKPVTIPVPKPVKAPEPEPVKAPEPEPVKAPEPEPVKVPEPDPMDGILERFDKVYSRLGDEGEPEEPLRIEKALCEVLPEMGEAMKKLRRNAIYLCDRKVPEGGVPVGASKTGGLPDLPPDIPYPTMTGFTFRRKGQKPEDAKVYPETAMHLVMQLNLYELAESRADTEGLFPKTGMLYIFWSGVMDDTIFDPDNKYVFARADKPELAKVTKVIWWDGDMSSLKRTEPTKPYYEEVDDEDNSRFDEECPEEMVSFADMIEYRLDELMHIENFWKIEERGDFQFDEYGSKLLGASNGGNSPYLNNDEIQLMELSYNVGCVWSLFWIMKKQDMLERNFDNIHLDADCD